MMLTRFALRLRKRLTPFMDLTAWVLLLVSLFPLWLIDSAMVATLVQWAVFGLALAGVSVVICRIILPQVSLSDWLELARGGNTAAGLVVVAVSLTLSITFLAMILWAKA